MPPGDGEWGLRPVGLRPEGPRPEGRDPRVADPETARTQAALASVLQMSQSTVWKSLRRLKLAKIYSEGVARGAGKVDARRLLDVLVHGLPAIYYPQKVGFVRGVPTGIFSPLFRERFATERDAVLVWPYSKGKVVGEGLVPTYPSIPAACSRDADLCQVMAAVEILRTGKVRERAAAEKYLAERFGVGGEEIVGDGSEGGVVEGSP